MAANLDRFVEAQDAIFPQACEELAQGHKRTHWMWFIFPQIAGLGNSPMARRYALEGLDEAGDFLRHPLLGARLARTTGLMLDWAGRRSAAEILGPIDAMKFCSAMTLLERAVVERSDDKSWPFTHALDAFYEGHRDARTLDLIRAPFVRLA